LVEGQTRSRLKQKAPLIVIPLKFEAAENFQGGRAVVKSGGKQRFINRQGRLMTEKVIGTATMEEEGRIILQLRAEGPGWAHPVASCE
jgi:hypothetical protein